MSFAESSQKHHNFPLAYMFYKMYNNNRKEGRNKERIRKERNG